MAFEPSGSLFSNFDRVQCSDSPDPKAEITRALSGLQHSEPRCGYWWLWGCPPYRLGPGQQKEEACADIVIPFKLWSRVKIDWETGRLSMTGVEHSLPSKREIRFRIHRSVVEKNWVTRPGITDMA